MISSFLQIKSSTGLCLNFVDGTKRELVLHEDCGNSVSEPYLSFHPDTIIVSCFGVLTIYQYNETILHTHIHTRTHTHTHTHTHMHTHTHTQVNTHNTAHTHTHTHTQVNTYNTTQHLSLIHI